MCKHARLFLREWHCTLETAHPDCFLVSFAYSHLAEFASHAVLHSSLVIQIIAIASPLQTGGKTFSFIYDYLKMVVDISACPTGTSFLCSHDTQAARSTFCAVKTSQRPSDLQNAVIHMLCVYIRNVEGETSGKGQSKDLKHSVHPL